MDLAQRQGQAIFAQALQAAADRPGGVLARLLQRVALGDQARQGRADHRIAAGLLVRLEHYRVGVRFAADRLRARPAVGVLAGRSHVSHTRPSNRRW